MKTQINQIGLNEEIEKIADTTKRDFIKKFGSYAASAPLAGFVLMTPSASSAHVCSNFRGQIKSIRSDIKELRYQRKEFKNAGVWQQNKSSWKQKRENCD
jgi:hypothetical protein